MDGVSIVFNDDGCDWAKHIASSINELARPPSQIQFDQDERLGYQSRNKLKIVVVIFTPGHKEFLVNKPEFDYRNVVQDPSRTVFFSCGACAAEVNDCDIKRKPLLDRLFEFNKWKKYDTTNLDGMVEEVEKMLKLPKPRNPIPRHNPQSMHPPPCLKVKLVNSKARCEDPTDITLSFEKEIQKEAKVELFLCDPVAVEEDIFVPTDWLNPYTHTFTAPEHVKGEVTVKVFVDGEESIVTPSTLTYVSSVNQFVGISQIYLSLMSQMVAFLKNNDISLTDLDNKLSGMFDDGLDTIPSEAFEMLFGIFKNATTETSEVQFPSLLHFAANYGFQEFFSRLSDLPDAALALRIANSDGRLPEEMAADNKHRELSNFIENFKNMGLDDIYVLHVQNGYLNVLPDDSQAYDSDGYLRARIQHAKSAGYAVMKGRIEIKEDLYYSGLDQHMQQPRAKNGPKLPPRAPTKDATKRSSQSKNKRTSAVYTIPERAPVVYAVPPLPSAANSQDKLEGIIEMFKKGELNMEQTEVLFQELCMELKCGRNKSFKEKQKWLASMQEQIKKAMVEFPGVRNEYQKPRTKDEPAPVLPPRVAKRNSKQ